MLLIARAIRWAFLGVLVLVLAASLLVFGLAYHFVPNIQQYKDDIAAGLSRAMGQRITIEGVNADWDGPRPHLLLSGVTAHDKADKPALTLAQIEATLSWETFVKWRPVFHRVGIANPVLAISRDAAGVFQVAGMPLSASGGDNRFADWLLEQDEITIKGAAITWTDGLRASPALALTEVDFQLENGVSKHHFAVAATPPETLGTRLAIAGEFKAGDAADLPRASGNATVALERVDLAELRKWVALPPGIVAGSGGLTLKGHGAAGRVDAAEGEFHLHGLELVRATGQEVFRIADTQGKLAWKALPRGGAVDVSDLHLKVGEGAALGPLDLSLAHQAAGDKEPATGQVKARLLEVAPLAALAEQLPIPEPARLALAAHAPRGRVEDFSAQWTGDWPEPAGYRVQGRFSGLTLNPVGGIPGVQNLAGQFDASDKGGRLDLRTKDGSLAMPQLFREPIVLGVLNAPLEWKRGADGLEVKFASVELSNAHFAGKLQGSWHALPGGPGRIDLTGEFNRGDARQVYRYIPLVMSKESRAWLDRAFPGGSSDDVKLRLKGDLSKWPFLEGSGNVFEVLVKVKDGMVDYAAGWPRIEGLNGDLAFRGVRMEAVAKSGSILGARLTRVKVAMADLYGDKQTLEIEGEATGPTAEFLRYVSASPVTDMLNRQTEGLHVSGNGKLNLKMALPIQDSNHPKIAGSYQFQGNRIDSDLDLLPLDQVTGRIEFSESTIKGQNITAQVLGGPATVGLAANQAGGFRLSGQGRLLASQLGPFLPASLAGRVSGGADWKATVDVKGKQTEIVVESPLAGLGLDLPAPLGKPAASTVPVKVEKRLAEGGRERLSVNYGEQLALRLIKRNVDGRVTLERGTVSLGGATTARVSEGIALAGRFDTLDVDAWRALAAGAPGAAPGAAPEFRISAVDVRADSLKAMGKQVHDLNLSAREQGKAWKGTLESREAAGEFTWRPEGRGDLLARLRYLALPEDKAEATPVQAAASASAEAPAPTPPKAQETELPALDIIADELRRGGRDLGRLELKAVQEGYDWRIEKLRLVNPESNLDVTGTWESWRRQPLTRIEMVMDVEDAGKLLARYGYPDTLKGGKSRLAGKLAWRGSPAELHYGSLRGNLELQAAKGQFLKAQPGIGRLLGILSLQALPRRITLDFRDVFSDGFAFDVIAAQAKITKGVMHTDDFRMQGPAARVEMSGDINLDAETQALDVKVVPLLGESVSVAGALLGGPVVGLTTFLVQKVFKDPLDQVASFQYGVTGTWVDPQVSKKSAAKPAEAPAATGQR